MIDLRCHLLRAAGGGPESFEESLQMYRLAASEGVRAMVAAVALPPHAAEDGQTETLLEECERQLTRLKMATLGGPGLLSGFVLPFAATLPAFVERHGSRLALGGGRHLLVRLPSLDVPEEVERVWVELERLGYGVVVARPECSPVLRREHRRLVGWIERGATAQVDAASLAGAHGREAQRFAWLLVETYCAKGRVAVASNARDATPRRPSLGAAAEELARKLGRKGARLLTEEVPARVLGLADDAARQEAARSWTALLLRPFGAKALPEET
jgi:protein-tyrosine phosphatase